SATTTRVGGTAGIWLRGDGVGAREDALGVQQDDQAVVDLGDRLDGRAARGGHGVELRLVDGEDLLDVVDHDPRHVAGRLDDHDLAALRTFRVEAQPGGEVVDRH